MKTRSLILTFICWIVVLDSKSQSYSDLNELTGFSIKTYYSPGNEERAKIVADRCEKAIKYVGGLIEFTPKITLLILNPIHWEKYATFPVYGMPHTSDFERLVVASDDNDFWRSFTPILDHLPLDVANRVRKAYGTANGTLSMMTFFDLQALHELGHAFHEQGGLTMQRLWMQELFSNMMVQTYVSENESTSLEVLKLLPEMTVASGMSEYKFVSLTDFENQYTNMDPKNYGWYQCRFILAAKQIYDAGGPKTFVKLWKALKENKGKLTDDEFAMFLDQKVSRDVAKVQTDW